MLAASDHLIYAANNFQPMAWTKTLTMLLSLLIGLSQPPAVAQEHEIVVRLASLEWPPFSGEALPDQGTQIAIARTAFEAVGYRLEVDFFPWSRTIRLGEQEHSGYAGYFPEYLDPKLAERCIFSGATDHSPLGFAQRNDRPVHWQTLNELSSLRIGVVQDYVNTPGFDRQVSEGTLGVIKTTSDLQNLRMLMAGRLDLAVIDSRVMDYLVSQDRELNTRREQLSFNPHILGMKSLHICFQRTQQGAHLNRVFSQGLIRIGHQPTPDEPGHQ
jgi:polar amino acid transport system substrate-binding protein